MYLYLVEEFSVLVSAYVENFRIYDEAESKMGWFNPAHRVHESISLPGGRCHEFRMASKTFHGLQLVHIGVYGAAGILLLQRLT